LAKDFDGNKAQSDFNRFKKSIETHVDGKIADLIGNVPWTPETRVRIAGAIDAQARAEQLAEINHGPTDNHRIDDLLAWIAEGHNSPAERCIAEVTPTLRAYAEKVGSFAANVYLSRDNPNDLPNFEKSLRQMIENVVEHAKQTWREQAI
jgi:hypothetical protein